MTEAPAQHSRHDRSKAEWRGIARANRRGLRVDSGRVRAALARALARPDRPPGWVVAYDALPGEADLAPLLSQYEIGPFALTRTDADPARRALTVHPASAPREQHRLGFTQPVAGAPLVADNEIGVVLVPGLAFDLAGRRLGHGGGYYDRFLARLEPHAWRIGVSDGYLVDRLPHDAHDIPMTHLATEVGVWPVELSP